MNRQLRAIIVNLARFLLLWVVSTTALFLAPGHYAGRSFEYALGLTPAWWPSLSNTKTVVTRLVGGAVITTILMVVVWFRGLRSHR
jgi:hypothetical protein